MRLEKNIIWLTCLIVLIACFLCSCDRFMHSRKNANQAAMIGSLKTLAAGQTDYNNNSKPHTYTGVLACLGSGNDAGMVPFIDPALSSGVKSGYQFAMKAGKPDENGSIWAWSATAWPVKYGATGVMTAYIDETAVIRGSDIGGGPGTVSLPEID
ncbi:hypothetical protein JW979_00135 [bacterium]|nr:hypothetical protein [candidate division CSSED10-310 bacterium]